MQVVGLDKECVVLRSTSLHHAIQCGAPKISEVNFVRCSSNLTTINSCFQLLRTTPRTMIENIYGTIYCPQVDNI